jgi:hypothetical protein
MVYWKIWATIFLLQCQYVEVISKPLLPAAFRAWPVSEKFDARFRVTAKEQRKVPVSLL